MIVLVCGSRTFTDRRAVYMALDGLVVGMGDDPYITVIDGAATGADALGYEWAQTWRQESIRFPADWGAHGRAAGPIRNQQMLTEGKPDLVLAFVDKILEQSRGTHDMVKRSRKAGVPVYVIEKMS